MIVVDSSALMAILLQEAEAERLAACLGAVSSSMMSAVSLLESSMVATGRLGDGGVHKLQQLIQTFSISIIPFDADQATHAADAFRRFGKGRDTAALNMGDCASYALAASHSLPLLYKGADFANTDMQTALPA
ncbi:MAG: type II toxin-antitoxin system VapC family toxin [Niveispirillum sp.]|uniref:type II toxin-antitoxin system VapC family toxin n=1 Tax=Niveispirillum sp. TaxID=1917217 RepID=UPI004036EEFE